MSLSIVTGAPGVRTQWMDTSGPSLDIGRTDVAGILGVAERGPFNVAVKVLSQRQFETVFGGPLAGAVLACAVQGFFANGGRCCWVVRVGPEEQARRAACAVELPGGARLLLQASSAGEWGNDILIEPVWGRDGIVAITATEGERSQQIELPLPEARSAVSRSLSGLPLGALPELGAGELIGASVAMRESWSGPVIAWDRQPLYLSGGSGAQGAVTAQHFTGNPAPAPRPRWGMDVLDRIDGISFVAAPDLACLDLDAATLRAAQLTLMARCIERRDRIAILDVPQLPRDQAPAYRDGFPDNGFGALYYPWICVDDALAPNGSLRTIPPSGHVAGLYARTDRVRGVHKPPTNEVLEGVWGPSEVIDVAGHGALNDAHINAIRALPGRGILVLGARTVAQDPRWWFVNVRRLFSMIEAAIDARMQWLVFEPNNPSLWRDIDRAVRGLLQDLYAAGMLDGATAAEAYSVQCDEHTNPASVIDEGRVVCDIGLQPPYPAEFLVVRIGVTRSGIQVEDQGARDG